MELLEELSQKLTSPEILQDFNTLKRISKEQKDLEEIVNKYQELKKSEQGIKDAKELSQDPEMFAFAQEELAKELNITQSSVSQRIKRSNFDLILETDLYFRKKITEL